MEPIPARSVAILADVHGNAAALEAVLADLEHREFDAAVLAGDYALMGPRPGESVNRLRALGVPALMGNTDHYLVADDSAWNGDPLHAWTRADLGADNLAWLENLSFSHRFRADAGEDSDLFVVHANPSDLESLLITEVNPFASFEPTTEDEARALIGETRAGLILYGHIHYASTGVLAGARLASIGAVGFPFDGDPRAAYAVAAWSGGAWTLTHHRVAYDYESVANEIDALGHSRCPAIAERLRTSRPVPLS